MTLEQEKYSSTHYYKLSYLEREELQSAMMKPFPSKVTSDFPGSCYPRTEMLIWKSENRRWSVCDISLPLAGSRGAEQKVLWSSPQLGSNPTSALLASGPGASYLISLSPQFLHLHRDGCENLQVRGSAQKRPSLSQGWVCAASSRGHFPGRALWGAALPLKGPCGVHWDPALLGLGFLIYSTSPHPAASGMWERWDSMGGSNTGWSRFGDILVALINTPSTIKSTSGCVCDSLAHVHRELC